MIIISSSCNSSCSSSSIINISSSSSIIIGSGDPSYLGDDTPSGTIGLIKKIIMHKLGLCKISIWRKQLKSLLQMSQIFIQNQLSILQ